MFGEYLVSLNQLQVLEAVVSGMLQGNNILLYQLSPFTL